MHTISGNDSLVLMPTGGGKSLCFQMSALLMEGMAVIVSPLISLMKDQVEGLRMNGIAAEALNSSNDEGYNRDIINRCMDGKVKMLYISPERLVGGMLSILQNAQVSLFAIDEAHCISGWGHDFRPEYTQGFGEYKAKAYGKPFIEAIKQYAGDSADLPFFEAAPFPEPLPFPDAVPSTKPIEPASYMERQKQFHANAYAKWDDEEDKKLTEYYRQGLSTSEIASLMNRNTGGISSRIKKLGLRDDSDSTINTLSPSVKKEKHREYRQELEKLAEMKAEIDKKIEELRKKMEEE